MSAALVVMEDNRHSSTYTDAENLARHIISRMDSVTAKLKSLEDDIRRLWLEFDKLKTGETILGCATKKEFCEKKLNRTPQAIRYMLNPELRESKQCLPMPEPKEIPLEDAVAEFARKHGATLEQVGAIAKKKLEEYSKPTPPKPEKPKPLSATEKRAAELQAFAQTLWSNAATVTVCRKLAGRTPFHFNLEIDELAEEDLRAAMTAASESRKQRVKKALAKKGKS
jgi:hypothetical protein